MPIVGTKASAFGQQSLAMLALNMANPTTNRSTALEALLFNILDYAGLFPPAQLPLSQTLDNYLADRESPYSWMLDKLIIPEALIAELEILLAAHDIKAPLKLSVLSSEPVQFIRNLSTPNSNIAVCALETKLGAAEQLENTIRTSLNECISQKIPIFFEVSWGPKFIEQVSSAIDILAKINSPLAGFKLRCGSTDPTAVPSVDLITDAIWCSSQAQVPIKFTAGLHHPMRMHQPEFGGFMHGFFNVYFGTLLAYANKLDKTGLIKVLGSQDANVSMGSDKISWLGYEMHSSEIANLRNNKVFGFGSCSFEEPIQDLKNLGWL